MRPKPDKEGYLHCEHEDCDFKCKKLRHLVYFKGKFLCFHCKVKASKSNGYIPKLNVKETTINHSIKLKDVGINYLDVRRLPREHWKDKIRVTDKLKAWADRQEAREPLNKSLNDGLNKAFWVGLSKYERQRLFSQLKNKGMDELNILREIDYIEKNIKLAHNQFKLGLKSEKSFKDEFNKLVNR